jgi:F-type H+-transporting ATPase subunit gamma
MLQSLASNVNEDSAPALLAGNGSSKRHLLVVVSSDRGLCGGFNANLVKAVKLHIEELRAQGNEVKILCLGKKAAEILKGGYSSLIVDVVEGITKQKTIGFGDAEQQAKTLISMFEDQQFDVCSLFFNEFVSVISQKPIQQQLIPLSMEAGEEQEASGLKATYEFEPSEEAILEDLLPRNIAVQIYRGLLENSASEQAARMTAMDNATRNAGEMIKGLTLQYNRSRQAAITTELIEIIAGAEAL